MDEREQIPLTNTDSSNAVRRRWKCPSDIQVALYLEQHLEPKEKSRFESHIADCDFCLAALGDLVRQQRASLEREVPIGLLHRAVDLVPPGLRASISWKWLLAPALACLVLVGVILFKSEQHPKFVAAVPAPAVEAVRPQLIIPQSPASNPEKQYVRSLATARSPLQLLEPRPGSVIEPQALKFRWGAVADTAYYEIRIVNAEGDLIWHGQSTNDDAKLPSNTNLPAGKYFVWVHAYLNSGRMIKSDATAFWVRKRG